MEAPPALRDEDVAAYVASLGLPGIIDLHVHFMPERVQAKVWAHFDRLDSPWPIVYRAGEAEHGRVAERAHAGAGRRPPGGDRLVHLLPGAGRGGRGRAGPGNGARLLGLDGDARA